MKNLRNDAKTYTLEEAHQHFGKTLNGKVWNLLQKTEHSKSEDALMIHAAHTSCYHWLSASTGLHYQRAEWLIAHVYTVLGLADAAIRHATRCLELTSEFPGLMGFVEKVRELSLPEGSKDIVLVEMKKALWSQYMR